MIVHERPLPDAIGLGCWISWTEEFMALFADLTDMKLFRREWPAPIPGPADRRGALRGTSTIVDDEGVGAIGADGVEVTGAAT